MSESLNGNLALPVAIDTNNMDWSSSPSSSVWRKRLHRVGPPEAGQVTSVVRYDPQSSFPPHEHPEGEEIFVLDGIFSDEHGDWPEGTYLLNPEGFRHTPFSKEGCILFVKLRQFPGKDRHHVVLNTHQMDWIPSDTDGVTTKLLYQQSGFSDTVRLEQWAPSTLNETRYTEGAELFVMDGEFQNDDGVYSVGSWLRFPKRSGQIAKTDRGCMMYVKEGGFSYLR